MKLDRTWQRRLSRLVEGLIGITFIAAAIILWRWFRDGGGLEAVYVAIGVLLAALLTVRRWLQAAAKPAASQHAGWGASTQGHNEMSALRQQMAQSLSLDDLRSLTFDLNLNFDNLAGETLERKIISLLESCRRQNRLPLLLAQLQAQRPHIAWAQVSALPAATTPQAQRNRENLLNNVQTAWIDGFLKQSLHSEVIKLSLSYRPEAVGQRPWQLILKQTGQPDAPVSPDETLLDIFTAAGRNLLILGEPGSGKTITLLQLAEALITLARQDPAEPLPIILNLSSWAREQPPLGDWLVEEMFVQYGVARDLTRAGIAQNQFLYLLDGLDEVAAEARDACVTALNEFKAAFPAELVVCSRTAEYAALQEQLHLGAAIQIKPLTEAQIEAYLAREGAELAAVRTTLAHDAELRELAQSPLMLSLMTLAYRGETAIDLRPDAGKETRRQHLFAHYVQKMFERRPLPPDHPYTQEQALGWLATIARGMKEHDQSVFYIERLQPTWLGNGRLRLLNRLTVFFAYTFVILLGYSQLYSLVAGLSIWLIDLEAVKSSLLILVTLGFYSLGGLIIFIPPLILIFWLIFWLIGYPILKLLNNVTTGPLSLKIDQFSNKFVGENNAETISLVEEIRWRRPTFRQLRPMLKTSVLFMISAMCIGFIVGILFTRVIVGTPSEMVFETSKTIDPSPESENDHADMSILPPEIVGDPEQIFLFYSLLLGIIFGGIFGSVFGLIGGLDELLRSTSEITSRSYPNQGIYRSKRNSLRMSLSYILISSISLGLIFRMIGGTIFGIAFGVLLGAFFGLFRYGASDIIKHYSLRWLLTRNQILPYPFRDKRLVGFFNSMNDCILLRRVGGGWIFIHRSLLEYFAARSMRATHN